MIVHENATIKLLIFIIKDLEETITDVFCLSMWERKFFDKQQLVFFMFLQHKLLIAVWKLIAHHIFSLNEIRV